MTDPMHSESRCTARRKNGTPCNNWAMLGTNVCRMHGGAAPQVRRAAQVRLLMAADRLMGELLKIAEDTSEPTPVRLAAIRDALDRAGLGARQSIEVEVDLNARTQWENVVLASLVPFEREHWDEALDGPWPYGQFDSYDAWVAAGSPRVARGEIVEAVVVDDEHERRHDEATEGRERARARRVRRGRDPELPPGEARAFDITRRPDEDDEEPAPLRLEPEVGTEAWNRRKEAELLRRMTPDKPRYTRRR